MSESEHKDGLRVRMLTSLAGTGITYAVDDTPILERGFALALCSEPDYAPRAEPIGWTLEAELASQPAAEPEPEPETDTDETADKTGEETGETEETDVDEREQKTPADDGQARTATAEPLGERATVPPAPAKPRIRKKPKND